MCEHNFISRFRKMQDTEKVLCHREMTLSKSIIKYGLLLNKVEKAIGKKLETTANDKRLEVLERWNTHLKILLRQEQAIVEELQQQRQQMQTHEIQFSKELQTYREMKARLSYIEQLCNIYVNYKALPDSIQGMVVCERQQGRSFVPFKFSEHDVECSEIPDLIWKLTNHTIEYKEEWEHLILGTLS